MKKTIIIITAVCFAIMLALVPVTSASAKQENNQNSNLNTKVSPLNNFNSRSAYVMDYDSGKVLFERSADDKHPIASMVKIMTLNIIFDEIQKGNLSLEEKITISQEASGMGGSQMFLDTGLEYTVSDLIKGITVVSANDASVAMAERITGSTESFVELMNKKTVEYDMPNTRFVNVTGLPQEGQYSTAKDVTKMMRKLLNHPKYYQFSNIFLENYTHPDGRVTELTNTNKLVKFYKGCDGGKTGFTNDAMFCLSATAKRDDMRVIATVLGAPTSKERNKEITALFNYSFSNYKVIKILEKGAPITTKAEIKGAKSKDITVTVDKNLALLSKKREDPTFDVVTKLESNIKTPISKGDLVGKVLIVDKISGQTIDQANLIATEDIRSKTYWDSIREILENWFVGK